MSGRYPKAFYIQRKKVIERDGNRCVICWRKWMLTVHHFPATLVSPEWNIDFPVGNLVTLCSSCHGKIATCKRGSPMYKMLEEIVVRNGGTLEPSVLYSLLRQKFLNSSQ